MESDVIDRVIIDDPPRMNLLGLILANIIERNLSQPLLLERFQKLSGSLNVQAREMRVSLTFEGGKLVVSRDMAETPRAAVSGGLDSLMNLSLGGGMVGPWLTGRLKTRGNLFFLLKIKPLLVA